YFLSRGKIPYRGGVDQIVFFAPLLQLSVLIQVKLQKFTVLSIGPTVRVDWIGVRRVILLFAEQLLVVALLKLYHVNLTEDCSGNNQFMSNLHIALMVASDFSYDFWCLHHVYFLGLYLLIKLTCTFCKSGKRN